MRFLATLLISLLASVGGGLLSRDGKPLNWFQLSSRNGTFVNAGARIV